MTLAEWLGAIGGGGGSLVAAGVAWSRWVGPWLRSRVIRDERLRLREMDHEAAREEREAKEEGRTIDRLWDRVDGLEKKHEECERRNAECERRSTLIEAKANRLEAENTTLAQRVERLSARVPDWGDEDTGVTRQVARIARRTPTPPDRAAVEEVHVRPDDERREPDR